jgi:hypothetical protein
MTDTVSRIPRAVVEQIIATALDGLDLTHDTAWIRPGSCPCRELPGRSCLLPPEEGGCQGHTAEVPTSDQHVVTAAILTAALPEPDQSGTLDAVQAALSVLSVIEQRLAPFPYTLRAHSLVRRLTEESERYEGPAEGSSSTSPAVPVSVLTCQWCQGPIPLARGPRARYCRNSHRVSAHKAKKRQQERQANAGASPGR